MNGFDLSTASNIYIGGTASAVYLGSNKIWPSPNYYANRYFTIIPRSTAYVCYNNRQGDSQGYYSLDEGLTWTACPATYDPNHTDAWKSDTSIQVGAGEKIMLKDTYSSSGYLQIHVTSDYDVEGNVMSMQDGDNFRSSTTLTGQAFYFMFLNETGLKDAQNLILPIMTLTPYCYREMFKGCTGLTSTPYLPATTLAEYCYYHMFEGCTSLQYACNNYDRSTWYGISGNGYVQSKYGLPATSFYNNGAAAYHCYEGMFCGCTNLRQTPVLPARDLVPWCYKEMFRGCTKLNRIYCFAYDFGTSLYDSTLNWVKDVSPTYPQLATFYKSPNTSNWQQGDNGIPNDWVVSNVQTNIS